MSVVRNHIRKGREILHQQMSLPAYAFRHGEIPVIEPVIFATGEMSYPAFGAPYVPFEQAPSRLFKRVTVRPHEKWTLLGDLKGTNFHYTESEEIAPKLILWYSEWEWEYLEGVSLRNVIVSIEPGLAYRIDSVQPRDDQTITVNVVRLDEGETLGFPYPEAIL